MKDWYDPVSFFELQRAWLLFVKSDPDDIAGRWAEYCSEMYDILNGTLTPMAPKRKFKRRPDMILYRFSSYRDHEFSLLYSDPGDIAWRWAEYCSKMYYIPSRALTPMAPKRKWRLDMTLYRFWRPREHGFSLLHQMIFLHTELRCTDRKLYP